MIRGHMAMRFRTGNGVAAALDFIIAGATTPAGNP